MRTRRPAAVLAPLAAVLLAACGGGGGDATTAPGTGGTGGTTTGSGAGGGTSSTSNAVAVRDNSFAPAATTVPVGSRVTWTWGGSNPHNVTLDDGVNSGDQTSGTFERTFGTAGTYRYHCTIHGAGMSGAVTVQ